MKARCLKCCYPFKIRKRNVKRRQCNSSYSTRLEYFIPEGSEHRPYLLSFEVPAMDQSELLEQVLEYQEELEREIKKLQQEKEDIEADKIVQVIEAVEIKNNALKEYQ